MKVMLVISLVNRRFHHRSVCSTFSSRQFHSFILFRTTSNSMASFIVTCLCTWHIEYRSMEYHAESYWQRSLTRGHACHLEWTVRFITEIMWRIGVYRFIGPCCSDRWWTLAVGLCCSIYCLELFIELLSNGKKKFQSTLGRNLWMYSRR